jgi:hypothetical protein
MSEYTKDSYTVVPRSGLDDGSAFPPQVVMGTSDDAANAIIFGNDGGLYAPASLPLTGGTVTGNVTFQGAANTFAQGSINSTAWGPLVIVTETANGTLEATDAGKVLVGSPAPNTDLTLTLPPAGTAAFKAGMVVELVSNVTTTGKYFYIQAPAGVGLFFNSTVGGSGDGTLGGGSGARIRLRGPLTSARLLALDGTNWWAFGELVGA